MATERPFALEGDVEAEGPGRQRPRPKPFAGILDGRREHVTGDPVPDAGRDRARLCPVVHATSRGRGGSSGREGRGAEACGAGEPGRVPGGGRGRLKGQAGLCTRPRLPRTLRELPLWSPCEERGAGGGAVAGLGLGG